MKRLFGILWIVILMGINSSYGQTGINWMSIEEAMVKVQENPKKVLIDVYTDWCGWCKVMDKNTFSHPVIAEYVNENYYAVKLNGETREDIVLGDRVYKYVPSGSRGYNELAAVLLNGRLGYPSVVFLDETGGILQPHQGYIKPDVFDEILRYYAENHYKSVSLDQFKSGYESAIKQEN